MSWSLLAPSLAWMVRRGRRALRFLELSPAPVPEVRRLAASVDHLSQGLGAGAATSDLQGRPSPAASLPRSGRVSRGCPAPRLALFLFRPSPPDSQGGDYQRCW